MRLGGPLFGGGTDPESWARAVRAKGYRAAYCPLAPEADDSAVAAYRDAAARADIVIAECGAWCNPLARDAAERSRAMALCAAQLDLAERIGARCCVNIAGSLGSKWDGPCADDLTDDAFGLVVESVRAIVDAVKPRRTFYTLETMPWMVPDSAECYERLLRAVGRESVAVHFDPVNLINSPRRYFDTGAVIRDFCHRLGGRIRSCHAKDIRLAGDLTVHLSETRPGDGNLDYRCFLRELARLDRDLPVMLEHLPDEKEYDLAALHLRTLARDEGVEL